MIVAGSLFRALSSAPRGDVARLIAHCDGMGLRARPTHKHISSIKHNHKQPYRSPYGWYVNQLNRELLCHIFRD